MTMTSSRWVYVQVDSIARETEKAFLLIVDGEEVWCPRSCIADPDDYAEGDEDVELAVSEWFARKEGLGPA
jgi:hypothetical protein